MRDIKISNNFSSLLLYNFQTITTTVSHLDLVYLLFCSPKFCLAMSHPALIIVIKKCHDRVLTHCHGKQKQTISLTFKYPPITGKPRL